MFNPKLIIVFLLISALYCLLIGMQTKTDFVKTDFVKTDKVVKYKLYKNYPYNRYFIVSGNKKYEVNKTFYNKIK